MSDVAYKPDTIAWFRSGDPAAFAKFLQTNRDQLLAFIQRRMGAALRRKVEAEDIFQEVCATALKALQTYRPDNRDPIRWLFELSERRIVDAHRYFASQKRTADREIALGAGTGKSQLGLQDLLVASLTTPSQLMSRNRREVALQDAMKKLGETQREALRLRYVEGLPTNEIAARLGKSDGSVRVMLSRVLQQLQQILGANV